MKKEQLISEEVKKLQKIAGILKESADMASSDEITTDGLSDNAKEGIKTGHFMVIKPDTKLEVGDDVVTKNNTQFGRISKIVNNSREEQSDEHSTYTITWADYGDKVRQNRQKLEKFWLLVKKRIVKKGR